jgi:hypothetical protein
MAEAEVYILVLSFLFMLLGLAGGIAKRASGKDLRVFKYLVILGVIGIIIFPFSILIATLSGRTSVFMSTLISAPLGLIATIGGGESYSEVCVDGFCNSYCCQDVWDPTTVWKDCDESCTSVKGVVGKNTGDDCLFTSRPRFCATTGTGGTTKISDSSCNSLEELGPVDCTCCSTSGGTKWWDCNQNCSSLPSHVGFSISNRSCLDVTQKACNDNSKDLSDTQNNIQRF